MSLDVRVKRLEKIPEDIKNHLELEEWCEEHGMEWYEWEESARRFPESHVSEVEVRMLDWEKAFAERGERREDYVWAGTDRSEAYGDVVYFRKRGTSEWMEFLEERVPQKTEVRKVFVVPTEDVGHMRGGANEQFYEDGKWEKDVVVARKDELLEDWRKYFSDTEEFREKIVDRFEEGKTIVVYW